MTDPLLAVPVAGGIAIERIEDWLSDLAIDWDNDWTVSQNVNAIPAELRPDPNSSLDRWIGSVARALAPRSVSSDA
jgi:hypothetical protein